MTLIARSGLPLLLAVASTVFFSVRAFHGVWFLAFVDEAEHLIGGLMLDNGAVLYRTFVDSHGPVIYMITQFYGAVFGWSHPNGARLIIVALTILEALCVATSPIVPDLSARLNALSLNLGLLATVWLLQALYMVNYHMVGGLLGGAALSLLVAPTWFTKDVTRWRALAGGACLALMGGTAYSFGPCAAFLAGSAVWASIRSSDHTIVWGILAGIGVAILGVLAWLTVFGDVKGFVVFHFLYNQFVFSRFTSFSLLNFISSLVPSIAPFALVQCLALVCWAISLAMYLAIDFLRPVGGLQMAGPITVGMVGLLTLCSRGGTLFQNGSFVVGAIASVSLALPYLLYNLGKRRHRAALSSWTACSTCILASCIALAETSMRQAVTSPGGLTRAQIVQSPRTQLGRSELPIFVKIRALTDPHERILAIPFAPDFYMLSGRMPMDEYTYYLPWDAAYAKSPWLDVEHNLCGGLAKQPPKLIFFNNWVVWDKYSMADYAPCVLAIMKAHYQRQADFPELYVRRDRAS